MVLKHFRYLLLAAIFVASMPLSAQETYQEVKPGDENLVYQGQDFYPVRNYVEKPKGKRPKNVILMIGDGMGLTTSLPALQPMEEIISG